MEPTTLVAVFGALALAAVLALAAALSRKGRTEDEARAYLAGVTYVLSDDPDAAIAELSRAAQLNRQTLETYFALGALFRRKGELDRAIRLHRNILLRPAVSADVRRRAQLALALDYKRGSLRGQAREAFEKLLAEEPDHREALLHYRQELEASADWSTAIEVQSRLVKLEGKGAGVLAHLLSACARTLLGRQPDDALELADRAVSLDAASADAQIARAEALLASNRPQEAAVPLARGLDLEPECAPRALPLLAAAFTGAGEVERFLERQITEHPADTAPFELALALRHKQQGRPELAIARLRRVVESAPRRWEARRELGALLLKNDRSAELRADYEEILGRLGEPAMGFVCAACRQRLPEHIFRCPACETWDVVRWDDARPEGI